MAARFSSALLVAVSVAALSACGSSRSTAPLAYGPPPAPSSQTYAHPQAYQAPQYQPPSYQQPSYQQQARAGAQPARLTPVTQDALQPAPGYAAPVESGRAPPANGALLVTVRPGDTVYAIARRTGASPQAIIAENRLRPPYQLSIGDTLRVPDPTRKIANDLAAPAPQPVSAPAPSRDGVRTVRAGETLYAISRSTGVPVADIAQANRLRAPYTLSVGQQLVIPGAPNAGQREAARNVADIARNVSYTRPAAPAPERMFDWPVKGALLAGYGSTAVGRRNDGINIAAPVGTPVRAAADGEVVYRGSELDGYGNLLLIKHADGFVTAYAHNDSMSVRKGQQVTKGQIIAKVGQTGAVTEPQLHFEIRQNLKAVDPLALLQ